MRRNSTTGCSFCSARPAPRARSRRASAISPRRLQSRHQPDSYSARSNVLSAAQVLGQQLNTMTMGVQALRQDAEQGIADSVRLANNCWSRSPRSIVKSRRCLQPIPPWPHSSDQRDRYINRAGRADGHPRHRCRTSDQLYVFTNSGLQLASTDASQLTFDAAGKSRRTRIWTPTRRNVRSAPSFLVSPSGSSTDLLANNCIGSGKIAAYVEMRDKVLPEAQAQLDAIAAGMAQMCPTSPPTARWWPAGSRWISPGCRTATRFA